MRDTNANLTTIDKDFTQDKENLLNTKDSPLDCLMPNENLPKDKAQEALYTLIDKLDLSEFVGFFESSFAREKSFAFSGDRETYALFLQELESLHLTPPPPLKPLELSLAHIQKFGTLHLEEIFEFVRLVNYFAYLKKAINPQNAKLFAWLDSISIPQGVSEICAIFTDKGEIKEGIYPHIDSLKDSIKRVGKNISNEFSTIMTSPTLKGYLVDNSLHFVNQSECLLVKSGFNRALEGIIISRSGSGFFYILPKAIAELKTKQSALSDKLQDEIYEVCKEMSARLQKYYFFLRFINKEFDVFDHLYTRISVAKERNLEFVYKLSKQCVLSEFCHPILHNPVPLSLSLERKFTIITGVNEGGKTMLLKSILSASLLSKYLLPFKINPHQSKIPIFKQYFSIISDPQNSKNNISTFAGRMLEFSQILDKDNFLLGIDEIELGTDSDEAASLYKVLLQSLAKKNCKVVLTTHHKRLAALMAHRDDVMLIAALYDEVRSHPNYEFLQGCIGKSYAYETALRHGIPHAIIAQAREFDGEQKQGLNQLITRSSELELELKQKIAQAQLELNELQKTKDALQEQFNKDKQRLEASKNTLQNAYKLALDELKAVMKENDNKNIHRAINKANTILRNESMQSTQHTQQFSIPTTSQHTFKKGDYVKYQKNTAKVIETKNSACLVEFDNGLKAWINNKELALGKNVKSNGVKIKTTAPKNARVSLDLHGKRVEEAIEEIDNFLSNALMAGFSEVLIFHGIGTGRLSVAVSEFLSSHPKVLEFSDAPPQMGGFGAKVVKL